MNSTRLLLSVFLCAASLVSKTDAQVFSENAVGYINHTFPSGQTLFGNQLNNTNNLLSSLMPVGGAVPEGAMVSLWKDRKSVV